MPSLWGHLHLTRIIVSKFTAIAQKTAFLANRSGALQFKRSLQRPSETILARRTENSSKWISSGNSACQASNFAYQDSSMNTQNSPDYSKQPRTIQNEPQEAIWDPFWPPQPRMLKISIQVQILSIFGPCLAVFCRILQYLAVFCRFGQIHGIPPPPQFNNTPSGTFWVLILFTFCPKGPMGGTSVLFHNSTP